MSDQHPPEEAERAVPSRARTTRQMRAWRALALALVGLLILSVGFLAGNDGEPRGLAAAATSATQDEPTALADELETARAEVASCRQLARVALGLGGEVVDAAVKHASGHDALRKGTIPVGDPRTQKAGTVWGDYWGPTLRVIHHGGKPAADAAEAWRRECIK